MVDRILIHLLVACQAMCDHILINYCKVCNVVFCRICGKEWGKSFEIEWFNDDGEVIAINYNCGCNGSIISTGCGCD